jgi:hypothetical protein
MSNRRDGSYPTHSLIRAHTCAAFAGLVLSALFGLAVSIKFHAPGFLGGHGWDTWGRLRYDHTQGILYAWLSNAFIAFIYYAAPFLTKRSVTSNVGANDTAGITIGLDAAGEARPGDLRSRRLRLLPHGTGTLYPRRRVALWSSYRGVGDAGRVSTDVGHAPDWTRSRAGVRQASGRLATGSPVQPALRRAEFDDAGLHLALPRDANKTSQDALDVVAYPISTRWDVLHCRHHQITEAPRHWPMLVSSHRCRSRPMTSRKVGSCMWPLVPDVTEWTAERILREVARSVRWPSIWPTFACRQAYRNY